MKPFVLVASFSAFLVPLLPAQESAKAAKPAAASKAEFHRTDAYPLDTCVVTGKALKTDAVVTEIGGRTFKTCCGKCPEKIKADPATYGKKLDDAVIASQRPLYPFDTCVISGKKLGAMGEPVALVVDNHLVMLCCGGCTKKAEAQKAEIVAKVEAAAFSKQKVAYAETKCPVSGEKIEKREDAVPVMHGLKLIELCCGDCVAKVEATPNAIAAKVATPASEPKTKAADPKTEKPKDGKDGGDGARK